MADLAPSRIRAFPAEVEDLKRKLASSRQELIASQHKLDALTKANTQLRALMIRREHEPACAPSPSSSRRLTDLFLSTGLDPFAMARMDQLVAERVRLLKGGRIYHAGEAFKALYMIRVGSCKTVLLSTCGESQIAAHYLAGEIVGADGIGTGVHKCEAIAMEATAFPFDQIETLAQFSRPFQRDLHKVLSDECARAQELISPTAAPR